MAKKGRFEDLKELEGIEQFKGMDIASEYRRWRFRYFRQCDGETFECPVCGRQMGGIRCAKCGHETFDIASMLGYMDVLLRSIRFHEQKGKGREIVDILWRSTP